MQPDAPLVADVRIARLATVGTDGRPQLVPITFALRGNVIVTAVDHKPKSSSNLARLRNIEADDRVSVLIDHYDEDWTRLWWVRFDGRARILRGPDRAEPISWLVAKYEQYRAVPPAGPVIWIAVTNRRGWSAAP